MSNTVQIAYSTATLHELARLQAIIDKPNARKFEKKEAARQIADIVAAHQREMTPEEIEEKNASEAIEAQKQELRAQTEYRVKRQPEYLNGVYIDAMMGQLHSLHLSGQIVLIADMAAAIDHWLGVKRKHPKRIEEI